MPSRITQAFVLLVALSPTACTVTEFGRLTGPTPVGSAPLVLHVDSHRYGTVVASLGSGQQCRGYFNTVAAETEWDPDAGDTTDVELSQVGMLILSCPNGPTVRCDFSRGFYGPGSGACRDGAGRDYVLQLL
jgi:hypothetical protein